MKKSLDRISYIEFIAPMTISNLPAVQPALLDCSGYQGIGIRQFRGFPPLPDWFLISAERRNNGKETGN